MTLQWHDAPTHSSKSKSDPWFGITMGLLGIIAGYVITLFVN